MSSVGEYAPTDVRVGEIPGDLEMWVAITAFGIIAFIGGAGVQSSSPILRFCQSRYTFEKWHFVEIVATLAG